MNGACGTVRIAFLWRSQRQARRIVDSESSPSSIWNMDNYKGPFTGTAVLQGDNKPHAEEGMTMSGCPALEDLIRRVEILEKQFGLCDGQDALDDLATTIYDLTSFLFWVVFIHLKERKRVPDSWLCMDVSEALVFKNCTHPRFESARKRASELQKEVRYLPFAFFVFIVELLARCLLPLLSSVHLVEQW